MYTLSLLLLYIPSVFQFFAGNKALDKKIRTTYLTVCIFSFFMQFIFSLIGFLMVREGVIENRVKCGIPGSDYLASGFLISIGMAVMMAIQYGYKKPS